MKTCKAHDWVENPDNPKKVICQDCKAEQYVSKLTKAVKQKLAEKKALTAIINKVAAEVEITKPHIILDSPKGIGKTAEIEMPEHPLLRTPAIVADTVEEEPQLVVDPADILMWVGGSFYNTPLDYIQESTKMGACKRVPALPRGMIAGESRVFLAHNKAINDTDPGIFAYYVVEGIVLVIKPGTDVSKELKDRGVEDWEYVEGGFGSQVERKCGNLATGGTYLISEENMKAVQDLAESASTTGQIIVLDEPLPLIDTKLIRGYKYVDGSLILTEGTEESEWFEGARELYAKNEKAIRKYHHLIRKKKKKDEQLTGGQKMHPPSTKTEKKDKVG